MKYNYRYRLKPTESQRETLDNHCDTCRQIYNHALYRFNQIPEDEGKTKCEREGTHFVEVEPEGTTKECAQCGVTTDKPLWVRQHSCPACGFETDRDANAAWNILSRGLQQLGVGHSEGTPVETALPVDTVVSAKRVVETESPCLKKPPGGE